MVRWMAAASDFAGMSLEEGDLLRIFVSMFLGVFIVSLVQRLGDSAVSWNVSQGLFTADGVWLRLEITGDKSRIDEARRLCRST